MQKLGAVALAATMVLGSRVQSSAITFVSDRFIKPTEMEGLYRTASKRVFLGDIRVDRCLITNNMRESNRKPTRIVIHDTANPSPTATTLAHVSYYQKNTRQASAHYTVDDSKVIQTVLDKDIAFHAGGMSKDGICNQNSIGIEMCINEGGDFKKTVDTTVKLTQYLMDKYNIPKSRVVRHYDITGKHCPGKFIDVDPDGWVNFKKALKDNSEGVEELPDTIPLDKDCFLYASPDKSSNKVAKIKKGVKVDLITCNEHWCKIAVKGTEGYIATEDILIDGPVQHMPINNMTTMYSNTDISKAKVTMISAGESVSLLRQGDVWSKVDYDGEVGYIATEKLNK